MAQPTSTTIACPNCRQPYNAVVEQLLDVTSDPTVKNRLLNGALNVTTCPHCGSQHQVSTPLLYHDASKSLAITYLPIELNLTTENREKLIGGFTTTVMSSLPDDSPKGYLLQPKQSLTMQGLIEQVLEADGITKDVIDAERKKSDIVDQLATATKAEREQLLSENTKLIDRGFFDRLTIAAQAASQAGDAKRSLRLLNIRSHLLETTDIGEELKAEQTAIMEAQQELQALANNFTREAFVDLLIAAADNPIKADALGQMGIQALDYQTFTILTNRIGATTDTATKANLEAMRDRLLQFSAAAEEQSRQIIEQAAETLRQILQSPNISQAVANNLPNIDDTFLQVLQANIQQAQQTNNIQASARLKQVRDEVLAYLQQGAPPEVQLINDLLSEPDEAASLQLLEDRANDLTPEFLTVLEGLSEQLAQTGNHIAVDRINKLMQKAQTLIPT